VRVIVPAHAPLTIAGRSGDIALPPLQAPALIINSSPSGPVTHVGSRCIEDPRSLPADMRLSA
jgi:hypothetical protein